MEPLLQYRQRFLAMPWPIRTFVAASLLIGVVFTVLPLVPGASFGLAGRQLNFQELWQTRVAFALFTVGPLMLAVGAAVFMRIGWVRLVLVILPVLQTLPFLVVHWAFGAPSPASSLGFAVGSCVLWAVLMAAYLFGTRGAREHFANVV